MKQPNEKEYVSHVAYCRDLELYILVLAQRHEAMQGACDKLTAVLAERTVERDAYQREADTMAAAHKVERDKWLTPTDWSAA